MKESPWGQSSRSVHLTVLARFVSSTGAEAAFFIGLWGKAAYEFDGTPTDLAIMSAIIGIAAMVGSVAGGTLVDRFDARRVVIGAQVVFVPATLSLILASDLPRLLALGTVVWLTGAVLETAITSLPPALVDDAGLDSANARLESANWLALVAGPALGGLMFPIVGFSGIFVFDAVTSVVALLLVLRVQLPDRGAAHAPEGTLATSGPLDPVADARPGPFADVLDGLRLAATNPAIRLVLFLAALPSLAFGMFIALEPLFFRDVVGAPVETLGYVNAIFGIGLFAGSMWLERRAGLFTTFRNGVLIVMASGLGSVLYVATGDLRVVLVGAITWSIPLGIALPLTRTLAQRAAGPTHVGRVTGLIGTVTSGASLLPIVVAPVLAATLGIQRVLLAAGLVAAVLAPMAWRAAGRQDRLRATTVAPSPELLLPQAGTTEPGTVDPTEPEASEPDATEPEPAG